MCSYILSNARGDTCWNKGETTTIRLSLCCPLVFVKKKLFLIHVMQGKVFIRFTLFFYIFFFWQIQIRVILGWCEAACRLLFGVGRLWSVTKPVRPSATGGQGCSDNGEKCIYQIIYYHVKHSAENEQIELTNTEEGEIDECVSHNS